MGAREENRGSTILHKNLHQLHKDFPCLRCGAIMNDKALLVVGKGFRHYCCPKDVREARAEGSIPSPDTHSCDLCGEHIAAGAPMSRCRDPRGSTVHYPECPPVVSGRGDCAACGRPIREDEPSHDAGSGRKPRHVECPKDIAEAAPAAPIQVQQDVVCRACGRIVPRGEDALWFRSEKDNWITHRKCGEPAVREPGAYKHAGGRLWPRKACASARHEDPKADLRALTLEFPDVGPGELPESIRIVGQTHRAGRFTPRGDTFRHDGFRLASGGFPEARANVLFVRGSEEKRDGEFVEVPGDGRPGARQAWLHACLEAVDAYNEELGTGSTGYRDRFFGKGKKDVPKAPADVRQLHLEFSRPLPEGTPEWLRISRQTHGGCAFVPGGDTFEHGGFQLSSKGQPAYVDVPHDRHLYVRGSQSRLDLVRVHVPSEGWFAALLSAVDAYNEKFDPGCAKGRYLREFNRGPRGAGPTEDGKAPDAPKEVPMAVRGRSGDRLRAAVRDAFAEAVRAATDEAWGTPPPAPPPGTSEAVLAELMALPPEARKAAAELLSKATGNPVYRQRAEEAASLRPGVHLSLVAPAGGTGALVVDVGFGTRDLRGRHVPVGRDVTRRPTREEADGFVRDADWGLIVSLLSRLP